MPDLIHVTAGKKHMDRFILSRNGKTVEEIAELEHVDVDTVKKSIRIVEVEQGKHTQEFLTQTLIGIVMKCAPDAQRTIHRALNARISTTKKSDDGEEIVETSPDLETQLRAFSEYRQLAAVAQPKPGHQTKIAVGVGLNVPTQASGSFVGAEDRLRDIKSKMGTQVTLPATNGRDADMGDESGDDDE